MDGYSYEFIRWENIELIRDVVQLIISERTYKYKNDSVYYLLIYILVNIFYKNPPLFVMDFLLFSAIKEFPQEAMLLSVFLDADDLEYSEDTDHDESILVSVV